MTPRAPELSGLVGAALVLGVAAGFLELAVRMIQLHWLHQVGLSTLRISRHVAWMVPVAETLVTLGLTLGLVAPALVWSAWRSGRPGASRALSWAWNWAGVVLGTLLFLGPLLAVRGLHARGAGAGRLCRHSHPSRRRPAHGGLATRLVLARGDRAGRAHDLLLPAVGPGWPGCGTGLDPARARAPNLLWIVMDTVRADRMSLYGYPRRTTPELDAWAREGIAFDMARSAAPWTLPSHVTMFTGLWPFEHGARIDRPYFGNSPTLAEHLAAAGYTTAGIVGNTGMCNASYGVGRGFDYYVELLCNHEVSLRGRCLTPRSARRS